MFGYSRQAHYKQQQVVLEKEFTQEMILDMVETERRELPRMGTRKLYHLLQHKGVKVGRDYLYRLLREHDLLVKPSKRFYVKTTQASRRAYGFKNLIEGISPVAPNQIWVADITYIRLKEGFAYLSLITDAFSRKIVGHHLHPTLDTDGCLNALSKAMSQVCWADLKGIIHHSDRGTQYCSKAYLRMLRLAKIRVSVTQKGSPYENALAERVNGILKAEWINQETYKDYNQAYKRIEEIIILYNTKRLHASCNYQTPDYLHNRMNGKAKKSPKKESENSFRTNFVNL